MLVVPEGHSSARWDHFRRALSELLVAAPPKEDVVQPTRFHLVHGVWGENIL